MVERPMVQGAKGKSVLDFICAAFMFNGDDMCCIQQVQLNSTNATAMTVCSQYIGTKTCVSNFTIHCLQYLPALFRYDVLKIKVHSLFTRNPLKGFCL